MNKQATYTTALKRIVSLLCLSSFVFLAPSAWAKYSSFGSDAMSLASGFTGGTVATGGRAMTVTDATKLVYVPGGSSDSLNRSARGWYAGVTIAWPSGGARDDDAAMKTSRMTSSVAGDDNLSGTALTITTEHAKSHTCMATTTWWGYITPEEAYAKKTGTFGTTLTMSGKNYGWTTLGVNEATFAINFPVDSLELRDKDGVLWFPAVATNAAGKVYGDLNVALKASGTIVSVADAAITQAITNEAGLVFRKGSFNITGLDKMTLLGGSYDFQPTVAGCTLGKGCIEEQSGDLWVVKPCTHNWTFKAEGDTFTATCSYGCGYTPQELTVKIDDNVLTKVYDGKTLTPSLKYGTSEAEFKAQTGATVGDFVWSGDAKSAGSHTVSVTITAGGQAYTISKTATITAADMSTATVTLKTTEVNFADKELKNEISSVTSTAGITASDWEIVDETALIQTGSGYSNCTYTVQLRGKGNYTGTKTVTWTVKAPTREFDSDAMGRGDYDVSSTLYNENYGEAVGRELVVTASTNIIFVNGFWWVGMTVELPTSINWLSPSDSTLTDDDNLRVKVSTTGKTYTGAQIYGGQVTDTLFQIVDGDHDSRWWSGIGTFQYFKTLRWFTPISPAMVEEALGNGGGDLEFTMTVGGITGRWEGLKYTDFTIKVPVNNFIFKVRENESADIGNVSFTATKILLKAGSVVTNACAIDYVLEKNVYTDVAGNEILETKVSDTCYVYSSETVADVTIPNVDHQASKVVTLNGLVIEAIDQGKTTYRVHEGDTLVITYTAEAGYLPATAERTMENVTPGATLTDLPVFTWPNVTVKPEELPGAVAHVFTNGAEIATSPYTVASNASVYVWYVADEQHVFADGSFSNKTAVVTAAKEPTEIAAVTEPQLLDAVATIVRTKARYAKLADAYAAAQAGDTVKFIVSEYAETIAGLPAGVTLEGTDGGTTVTTKLDQVAFTGVTFKNLKFAGTDSAFSMCYSKGSGVTFDGCEFNPQGKYAVHFDGSEGTVMLTNCTVRGTVAIAGTVNSRFVDCTFAGKNTAGYCNINFYTNAVFESCWFGADHTSGGSRGILSMGNSVIELNDCTVEDGEAITSVARRDYLTLVAIDAGKDENGKFNAGTIVSLNQDIIDKNVAPEYAAKPVDETGVKIIVTGVAQVGTTRYATLSNAVLVAVNTDNVVTQLADVAETIILPNVGDYFSLATNTHAFMGTVTNPVPSAVIVIETIAAGITKYLVKNTVSVEPQAVDHAEFEVTYTNVVQKTVPFRAFTNDMITVKYTASNGWFFADGKTTCEITYKADKDPALVPEAQLPKVEAAVAKIGTDTYYHTLAKAVAEAQDGETVTVLTNINLAAQQEIAKTLTIDLNGFEIAHTNTTFKDDGQILVVNGDGKTVTVRDSSVAKTGKITGGTGNNGGALVVASGTLNIEGGVYSNNMAVTSGAVAYVLNGGQLNVNGGLFVENYVSNNTPDKALSLFATQSAAATCSVSNGWFDVDPWNYAAPGRASVKVGDRWTMADAVCQIGNHRYFSISNAIENAGENDIIELVADTDEEVVLRTLGQFFNLATNTFAFNGTVTTPVNGAIIHVEPQQDYTIYRVMTAVAQVVTDVGVTTNKYAYLGEAIADLDNGDTVMLLATVSADGFKVAKNITLDLNGQNLAITTAFTNAANVVITNGLATGGLDVDGRIVVESGALDASALTIGVGGLTPGQNGGLDIANGATFKIMSAWASASPNWMAANRLGFLVGEDGAMVAGTRTYIYSEAEKVWISPGQIAKAEITSQNDKGQQLDYVETYDTLKDAMVAVKANGLVSLLGAATTEGITLAKNATINLNGQDLTNGTCTVAAETTVAITNGVAAGGIVNVGTVTVNGTLDMSTLTWGAGGFIPGTTGALKITSTGTVKMNTTDGKSPNWMAANMASFLSQCADGATLVIGDKKYVKDSAQNLWVLDGAVAKATIAGTSVSGEDLAYLESYTTLAGAVSAVTNNGTVTLLANCGDVTIEKAMTFVQNTFAATNVAMTATGWLTLDGVTETPNVYRCYTATNFFGDLETGAMVKTDKWYKFLESIDAFIEFDPELNWEAVATTKRDDGSEYLEVYETFAAAFATVATNGTVYVLKNVTNDGFTVTRDMTIDLTTALGDVALTVTSSAQKTTGIVIAGGLTNVTFRGGTVVATNVATVIASSADALTLDGVTVNGDSTVGKTGYAVQLTGGTTTITNSSLVCTRTGYALNVSAYGLATSNSVTFLGANTVTGNIFVNVQKAVPVKVAFGALVFDNASYKLTVNAYTDQTVITQAKTVDTIALNESKHPELLWNDVGDLYRLTDGKIWWNATKGGDNYYPTLQAAYAAASVDDTLVACADDVLADELDFQRNTTLDLNGHTLTVDDVLISRDAAVLTIVGTNANSRLVGRLNALAATLVLRGGVYACADVCTVTVQGAGKLDVADAIISCDAANEVAVQIGFPAYPQYSSADARVTILNSRITGYSAAYIGGGQLTVSNSVLTATGAEKVAIDRENCTGGTGDALVIDQSLGKNITVDIQAGTKLLAAVNSTCDQFGWYKQQKSDADKASATKYYNVDLMAPLGYAWYGDTNTTVRTLVRADGTTPVAAVDNLGIARNTTDLTANYDVTSSGGQITIAPNTTVTRPTATIELLGSTVLINVETTPDFTYELLTSEKLIEDPTSSSSLSNWEVLERRAARDTTTTFTTEQKSGTSSGFYTVRLVD